MVALNCCGLAVDEVKPLQLREKGNSLPRTVKVWSERLVECRTTSDPRSRLRARCSSTTACPDVGRKSRRHRDHGTVQRVNCSLKDSSARYEMLNAVDSVAESSNRRRTFKPSQHSLM